MPGSVIQGSFPQGVRVSQLRQAATSPLWVQERIAAGARATAPAVQPKAAAPRVTPNGTSTPLPPQLAQLPVNGGQPLDATVRQMMEAAFGQSFADVRVHVGQHAPAIGAVAFTHGSHIHFAPGRYDPSTPPGRQVLAHELAHVVQQRAGRVQNPFGNGVAVVQNAVLEAEADRMARRAAAMPVRQPMMRGGGVVQGNWIEDHPALRLRKWRGDQTVRQNGWYSTDALGAVFPGPLTDQERMTQLETYCTTKLTALPAFNEAALVRSYGGEGNTQQAVVDATRAARQARWSEGDWRDAQTVARQSIAIFYYMDLHSQAIERVTETCFSAIDVGGLPQQHQEKGRILQHISLEITEKMERGIFADPNERDSIIDGETRMRDFLIRGKALLTRKAGEVARLALPEFIMTWAHGSEAKSYARRVISLELAGINALQAGARFAIRHVNHVIFNDGYQFLDDTDAPNHDPTFMPVDFPALRVGTTYGLFRPGAMDAPHVRVVRIQQAPNTVLVEVV